jgi:hypothetical protein
MRDDDTLPLLLPLFTFLFREISFRETVARRRSSSQSPPDVRKTNQFQSIKKCAFCVFTQLIIMN